MHAFASQKHKWLNREIKYSKDEWEIQVGKWDSLQTLLEWTTAI